MDNRERDSGAQRPFREKQLLLNRLYNREEPKTTEQAL